MSFSINVTSCEKCPHWGTRTEFPGDPDYNVCEKLMIILYHPEKELLEEINHRNPINSRCPYNSTFTKGTVPASNFLGTLHANIKNDKVSDKAFREFAENSIENVYFLKGINYKA